MIKKTIISSVLYVTANLIGPLSAFALLPILTRYLTTEEIGGIFVFQAILLLSVNFVSVGSMSVLQGLYFRIKDKFPVYLSSSILMSGVIWTIICFMVYWNLQNIFPAFGLSAEVGLLALFVSLGGVLQALYLALLQIREQPGRYFIVLSVVYSVSFFLSVILILWCAPTVMSRVIGICCGILCGASIAVYYFWKEGYVAPNLEIIRGLFVTGLPVIVHSSAMLLISQTDKFLLGHLVGLAEVGSYGVSAQLASVVQMLAGGMAMVYTPMLYKKLSSPLQNDFGKANKFLRFSIIALFISVGLWILFVNYFNPYLFGPNFIFEKVSFVILAVGSCFFGVYHFFSGYFYYFKYTKILAIMTCSIALVNLIVSYILIPKYGADGAAVGSLVAYVFAFLCAACCSVFIGRRGLTPV